MYVGFVAAQPTVSINRAYAERTGNQGTFRFQNSDADLRGQLYAVGGDGPFTACSTGPCRPGQLITIYDLFSRSNAIRAGPDAQIANGTSYQIVFYLGTMIFDGGTVRIPYYVAKRKAFKITVKSRLTGIFSAYPNLLSTPTQAYFHVGAFLEGTTTVFFNRVDDNPTSGYNVVKVVHNYPAP